MTRWAVLIGAVLLAGCGAAPTHYYTLAPVPPASAIVFVPACAAPRLTVRRALLPGVLDRDSLVRMKDATALDISRDDRWASPLDSMVRSVLAEDLRQRLGADTVMLPGDPPAGGETWSLALNVTRFAADPAGRVMLQADWTLLDAAGAVRARRSERIDAQAANPEADAVVTAMSGALGQLADRVAVAVRQCPGG